MLSNITSSKDKYFEVTLHLSILRTKFEQILDLKPLFRRRLDLFFQVRGGANFEKIAQS